MVKVGFSVDGGDELEHTLDRFRHNVQDATKAFQDIGDHFAKMQRDQFAKEGGRYGTRWDPLTAKYAKHKSMARPGKKILEYDGHLRKAAAPKTGSGFSFYKVTKRSGEYGLRYSDVPYAEAHQKGEGNLPKRQIMGEPSRQDQKIMTKILHDYFIGGVPNVGS